MQISIIVPCIKNSELLNKSIAEYLKVKNLKKIFIVIENINENLKILNEKVEYIKVDKNSNMSFKRNLAARKADTEYLAFYDSDSYPKNPNILELAIKIFEKDKNIYALGGPDISPENQTLFKRVTGKRSTALAIQIDSFLSKRTDSYFGMCFTIVKNRSVLLEKRKSSRPNQLLDFCVPYHYPNRTS